MGLLLTSSLGAHFQARGQCLDQDVSQGCCTDSHGLASDGGHHPDRVHRLSCEEDTLYVPPLVLDLLLLCCGNRKALSIIGVLRCGTTCPIAMLADTIRPSVLPAQDCLKKIQRQEETKKNSDQISNWLVSFPDMQQFPHLGLCSFPAWNSRQHLWKLSHR